MRLPRTARLALVATAIPVLAISLAPQAQAGTPPLIHVAASGTLASSGPAFSYDATLAPVGATMRVDAWYLPSGHTVVVLRVRGLVPNREYGSHAHTNACGATGAVAGPHFQQVPQIPAPSAGPPVVPIDPAYANADNEIWLDFTTDSKGRGWAIAVQDWQPSDRRPASVVIHLEHTHDGTDPTLPAGTAGARLACLSVGF